MVRSFGFRDKLHHMSPVALSQVLREALTASLQALDCSEAMCIAMRLENGFQTVKINYKGYQKISTCFLLFPSITGFEKKKTLL